MSNLDILVEISKIARLVTGSVVYRRMFSNALVVIAMAVVTGMLVGIWLMAVFYAAYVVLVQHGLDTDAALLTTCGLIAMTTLLSAGLTAHYLRKWRRSIVRVPAMPHLPTVAQAFMDGFTAAGHAHEKKPARAKKHVHEKEMEDA